MTNETKIEVKIPTRKSKCDRNFGRMPAAYDLHACTGGEVCAGDCQPVSRMTGKANDDGVCYEEEGQK